MYKVPTHFFIGTRREFEYFMDRWVFNRGEWILIDRYELAVGRHYLKGYVHQGDSAYLVKDLGKLMDYIDVMTAEADNETKN